MRDRPREDTYNLTYSLNLSCFSLYCLSSFSVSRAEQGLFPQLPLTAPVLLPGQPAGPGLNSGRVIDMCAEWGVQIWVPYSR